MPLTFEKLVRLVRERAEEELGPRLARSESETDTAVLERIVLHTITSMGFHVGRGGEVCDPRPTPNVPTPKQTSWYTRGNGRRR